MAVNNAANSIQTLTPTSMVTFNDVTLQTTGALRTSRAAGSTALLQAFDTDTGPAYVTFATLTANTTPTMDLSDSVTKSGGYIYRAGGTAVAATDGGTGQSTYTTGDLLYASATNTLSKLPITTIPGTSLIYDGTNVAWGSGLQNVFMVEDWISIGSAGTLTWRGVAGGGALNTNADGDSAHPGTVTLATNASTTAGPMLVLGANSATTIPIILGGGVIVITWVFKLSALSTVTDTYTVRAGLSTATTAAAIANGVYFEYSDIGATPNWMRATTAASVTTSTSTAIAAGTGWTTLSFVINAAASSIEFFVNGVSGGSNVATIPTVNLAPFIYILKSAGATNTKLILDYFSFYQKLTAAR